MAFNFLTDQDTDDLKSTADQAIFITANQLSMAGDGKDPQIVIITKVFPIKVGKVVPIGHNLQHILPADGNYTKDFKA